MKTDKLIPLLRSGFPAIWLKTHEPNRVRKTIYPVIDSFTRKDGNSYSRTEWTCTKDSSPQGGNPLKPLMELQEAPPCTILFVYNWHWFADKPQVVQFIQDSLPIWANQNKALICVSPAEKIPMELQKDFVLLDMPLPNEDEIRSVIHHVAPSEGVVPKDKALDRLVSTCRGLTAAELEAVLALSFVESGGKEFQTTTINQHRAMSFRKTGFIEVLEPNITFSDIIGYNDFKQFVLETIDNPKAKGVMAIGQRGCGKTSIMKAIVAETGKLGLSINMGSMFSKYQGETDANINMVIGMLTAVGDCFVLIDEFEKQFAGAGSDGTLDSGTTRRATGRWLEFLQDRPAGIYISGTANSFAGIPSEYLRPGRWDTSPFYFGLPNDKTRMKILEHYVKKAGMEMPTKKMLPDTTQFSGAEVEALVHIAEMRKMNLLDASAFIKPQAITMAEEVQRLHEWAKDRTLPAEAIPSISKTAKRSIDV